MWQQRFSCFTFTLLVLLSQESKIHSFLPDPCFLGTAGVGQILFSPSTLLSPHSWCRVAFHSSREWWSLCTPSDAPHEKHLRRNFSSCCVHVSLEFPEGICKAPALAAHHRLWCTDHCLMGQVEENNFAVFYEYPCATKKQGTSISRAANPAVPFISSC